MLRWIYRHLLRGIGIVVVLGMLTALAVTLLSQFRHSPEKPRSAHGTAAR